MLKISDIISDQFHDKITINCTTEVNNNMFLAIGSITNKTTISWINGGDAIKTEAWLSHQGPPKVELGMLPTAISKGTIPNVDINAKWTRGTIYLDRPVPTTTPGGLVPLLAPTTTIKLMDTPDFKLKQFFPNGAPFLDYNSFATPGPMIRGDVSLIRLASIEDLKAVSPNKRLYPLAFPGVKPPNLPEPVPAVAGPSSSSSSAAAKPASGSDSSASPRRKSSTAESSSASTPPGSARSRLRTRPLRYRPTFSPVRTIKVGVLPAKRQRTSLTVDLTVKDESEDETNPDHGDDTIDLCDSSQDDSCAQKKDDQHDDPEGGQGGAQGLHN